MDSHIESRPIRRRSALLLLAIAAIATSLLATNPNPGIAPPNSKPHGASYAQWSAAWWQWAFSLHAYVPLNPLLATGAVDCSYGQTSDVWFLVGTVASGNTYRNCSIPTGTWLLFPVFDAWCDNVGVSPPATIDQLKQCAADYVVVTELHASIDGVPVSNLSAYHAAYAPFGYTVPAVDNMLQYFGADMPGKDWPTTYAWPAATDGYWLMLNPLPPGFHTINFGGTNHYGFQIDITYAITVVPKGQF